MTRRILNTYTEYTGPDDEWTEKEQEKECCTFPISHDECIEDGRKEPYDSADRADLDFELEKARIKHENAGRRIIGVYLKDKGPDGPCGEKVTDWEEKNNCCDQPAPVFVFTTLPPASISWNKIYKICATGGYPPYTWSVEGAGLTIGDQGNCAQVAVSDCFCNTGKIVCTDVCGQVLEYEVSSLDMPVCDSFAYDDVSSVDVIQDNSSGAVYVDGGMPPFTVSVSGIGFFLDSGRTVTEKIINVRYAYIFTANSCGGCSINFTDACGLTVNGFAISSEGEWIVKARGQDPGPNDCPIIAPADYGTQFGFTYTVGDKRIELSISSYRYGYSLESSRAEAEAQCLSRVAQSQAYVAAEEAEQPGKFNFCKDYLGPHPICPDVDSEWDSYNNHRTPLWNRHKPAPYYWYDTPPDNSWYAVGWGRYYVYYYLYWEYVC